MKNDYPVIAENDRGGTRITYGIVGGTSHIVFIKTGRGGTIFRENDDQPDVYPDLAGRIRERFGYTVIVADNPLGENRPDPLIDDMGFLNQYAEESRLRDVVADYVGFSAGADYGAWYGHLFPVIRRMLLINPIVNLNPHRMKDCCDRFSGEEISFLFGESDPSARYAFLIPTRGNVCCEKMTGQGHLPDPELFIAKVLEFLNRPKPS